MKDTSRLAYGTKVKVVSEEQLREWCDEYDTRLEGYVRSGYSCFFPKDRLILCEMEGIIYESSKMSNGDIEYILEIGNKVIDMVFYNEWFEVIDD